MPQRPRQAVILAGGRGTRMLPLTEAMPKAMIAFHGKPFLEHLVDLLRSQGFERILMLLGYQAQLIQNHFGDGSRFGVSIEYSVSDPDELTAARIARVASRLDAHFLLLYCDNYWPMPFDRMWERYLESGAQAMVTVYRNHDDYTRNSIALDERDYVRVFDKSRKTPGLRGVEIGFAILTRELIQQLGPRDQQIEEALYPDLAAQGQLAAFPTEHRYYSVGSLERLPLTSEFLARRPAILLDRDGVLNRKPPRAEYVRTWEEWEWIPGAKEALALLHGAGYRIIVVSNQAGVARGLLTEAALAELHARMQEDVAVSGGHIDRIYHCPHHWDDGCACRKPKPGMLYQAQRDFHLDLTRTVFVGDDERDAEAARAAHCLPVLVSERYTLLDFVRGHVSNRNQAA